MLRSTRAVVAASDLSRQARLTRARRQRGRHLAV